MKVKAQVTLLLPVRDAAHHLPEALASLSAQTFGDWVCLVRDDGSTDGSAEILAAHAAQDPRFRVARNPRHLGVPATLQLLLAQAETPWIARMDGDDTCSPTRLASQIEAAQGDPAVDLWGCIVEPLGQAAPGWRSYLEWLNRATTHAEIVRHAFTECPLPHPSWFGKRQTLTGAGGYRDGPFPEDYDLFLHLLRRGARFGKVAQPLVCWRDHPARETRVSPRTRRDAFLRLKARHLAAGLLAGELPHLPRRPVRIWGAGKTGRILLQELRRAGLPVAGFVDPLKAGRTVADLPVVSPEGTPAGRELLLVAVGPRHLRRLLERRLRAEGRSFGSDYLWLY